ncbi:MAG: insulinase family protein [Oscillospiraceae bacterium]|nr:insulinase family protein [Oscillospiraceae bacterium]
MSGFQREKLADGVYFSSVRDEKFKSNRITAAFLLPLGEETAPEYAVVPLMLKKGYRECPDFTALNIRLQELYGASVFADVQRLGNLQGLTVSVSGICSRFAPGGEQMERELASLLAGMLTDPALTPEGSFAEADFIPEKQFLADTIESRINDKRYYARSRCRELLFEGVPYGLSEYGTLQTLAPLTAAKAAEAYRRLLKTARIELIFLGAGDPEEAKAVLAEAFRKVERAPLPEQEDCPPRPLTEKKIVREEMEVVQANLDLGFYAPQDIPDEVIRLMVCLYGGSTTSKLFVNVREKQSLCYFCSAGYDSRSKSMLVYSGVDGANLARAEEEILRQLQMIARGEFTETELADNVRYRVNAYRTVTDSLSAQEGYWLGRILAGELITPAESAERILRITPEQISQAAAGMVHAVSYTLCGRE